jgi:peptidoglycan/LPS O-acetylase OafA/YrhL
VNRGVVILLKHVKPPHIPYLDFFRAAAILGVIVIHATSQAAVKFPETTLKFGFYHFWNSICQFAVPSFLFLSGLVLFYTYHSRAGSSDWFVGFYRKRLTYIVAPYIIWSLVYFVTGQIMAHKSLTDDWPRFLHLLIIGKNYAHLYFFIIIIPFYLLFPWFIWCVKFIWVRSWLLPLSAVGHFAFYLLNTYVWHFHRTSSMFPNYLLQIGFGAWLGLNFEQSMVGLGRWKWPIALSGAVSALIYVYAGPILDHWLPDISRYSRMNIRFVIYTLFTLIASLNLLLISRSLFQLKHAELLKRVLNSWGKLSFGIFLIHPIFIFLWRTWVMTYTPSYYHLGVLLGGVFALLFSWPAVLLLRRSKWGGIVMGK